MWYASRVVFTRTHGAYSRKKEGVAPKQLFARFRLARRAREHFSAVAQGYRSGICVIGAVLCQIAYDGDQVSRFQGAPQPATTNQSIRTAQFEIPRRHLAALSRHI